MDTYNYSGRRIYQYAATVVSEVNRPYVPTGGAKLTAEIEVEPGRRRNQPRDRALCRREWVMAGTTRAATCRR